MSTKKIISDFLIKVRDLREVIPFPEGLTDKHGRAIKREAISMYINKIGNEMGVKFFTMTTLNGQLVVGVRPQ